MCCRRGCPNTVGIRGDHGDGSVDRPGASVREAAEYHGRRIGGRRWHGRAPAPAAQPGQLTGAGPRRPPRYWFTASRMALPALKTGTRRAAMGTASPVCGFRPGRAGRSLVVNVPNLATVTDSPRPGRRRWPRERRRARRRRRTSTARSQRRHAHGAVNGSRLPPVGSSTADVRRWVAPCREPTGEGIRPVSC